MKENQYELLSPRVEGDFACSSLFCDLFWFVDLIITCLIFSKILCLQEQEVAIFWELSHVQEALDELNKAIGDPSSLPDTIEQVRMLTLVDWHKFYINNIQPQFLC